MIKVSIIVPSYNHANFLVQRFESILNQTYRNFELIILDDCSTDGSQLLIDKYAGHPKVSALVYNKKNSGSVYAQWERGIKLAKGDYIWLAESDDWAEPDFLWELVQLIADNQSIGICFCGSIWVDDKGEPHEDLSLYYNSFRKDGKQEISEQLVYRNTIQNASAALIRSDSANKYLKQIKNFRSCGDWYLYINILSESELVFTKQKLNYFRWYHANTSNKAAKDGLWISEGIKILSCSNAYKVNYSTAEFRRLYADWKKRLAGSHLDGLKMRVFFYTSMAKLWCMSKLFKLLCH